MAGIGVNQYQILSPEQANPIGYGLAQGIQAQLQAAQARAQRAAAEGQELKNPFVQKREMADLLKEGLESDKLGLDNSWINRLNQSTINSQSAGANYQNAEATNANYKRENGLLQTPEIQNLTRALEMSKQAAQANTFAQQNQVPNPNLPDFNINIPQSKLQSTVGNLLTQQSNAAQMPNIPEVPAAQPQQGQRQGQQQGQQMLPGTNIPSLGNPVADIFYSKLLGIKPAETDQSLIDYRQESIKNMRENREAMAYKSLPAPDREYENAAARGLGYSATDAANQLLHGKTLEDLAEAKGYDRNNPDSWPTPAAPPTKAVITRQQNANIARAGVNAIEPIISKNLAPYSQTIWGVSPLLISKQVSGLDKDGQAKAIASAFVSTEANVLQARSANIQNVGIGLIRMLNDKSNTNLKTLRASLDPEVFQKVQDYIRSYGNIINNAENKEMWNVYRDQSSQGNSGDNVSNENRPHAQLSDKELDDKIAAAKAKING